MRTFTNGAAEVLRPWRKGKLRIVVGRAEWDTDFAVGFKSDLDKITLLPKVSSRKLARMNHPPSRNSAKGLQISAAASLTSAAAVPSAGDLASGASYRRHAMWANLHQPMGAAAVRCAVW